MRLLCIFICLVSLAHAQAVPAAGTHPTYTLAPPGAEDPAAKQARAVIDHTIQALGGDAWMKLRYVYQEGRTSGFNRGQPTGEITPFWRWISGDDKERVELLKKHEWVIIFNGDKGWDITFNGVKPYTAEQMKEYEARREHSIEHVLRDWTRDPKTIYFLDADRFVDAKQAYSVTILNGVNESVTLLIDKQTYLPLRKIWTARDPATRDKDTEEEIWGQYRVIEGIETAFVNSRTHNGITMSERFLAGAHYNQPVPDAIFSPDYKGQAPH